MREMNQKSRYTGEEIAVIGMAGRFPGARDLDEFWDNMKNGIESISFFPGDELEEQGIDSRLIHDPYFVKAKGVLEDIEYFDTVFFGYSPAEAEKLDPQTRVFLEVAREALANAGYDTFTHKGEIGLFATASPREENKEAADNNFSRCIARRLNLKEYDSRMPRDCTNSLAAIHLACQSLLKGECSMALAGGVSVTLPAKTGYMYREGRINSPDGHCRAFDISARGTGAGDGSGIVVLKTLQQAAADGDCILALIKGTTLEMEIQSTGRTGIPAPGLQTTLVQKALQKARVKPETIGYIETHGIGTLLSDAVEVRALTRAFNTDKKGCCAIGSVKTNIGHLDSAAGTAGFIKTLLMIKHRQLPPGLNFENPNPNISFLNTPFYVNTRLTPWESNENPLRAGISSFGTDCINIHIIVEEAGETRDPAIPSPRFDHRIFTPGLIEARPSGCRAIELEDALSPETGEEEKNQAIKQQEEYWQKEFNREIPEPYIPTDKKSTGHTHARDREIIDLNRLEIEMGIEKTYALKRTALAENMTLRSLLLAVTFIFLAKISNREEIVIGTLVENHRGGWERDHQSYTNILALKCAPQENKPLAVFLQEVRRKFTKALDNRDYPFQHLEKLVKKNNPHCKRMFNVMFVYRTTQRHNKENLLINLNKLPGCDMILEVVEADHGLQFVLEYNKNLLGQERAERYARHFREVLSSVVENRGIHLKDIAVSHDVLDSQTNIPQMEFGF
jgi:3-oxoacyl-(acyl-carrier-protein) synthase